MTKPYEVGIPDSAKRISTYTFNVKEYLWMNSLAQNMSGIRNGRDVKDLPKREDVPALVIGAGPSINKHQQLKIISKSDFKGTIFVCDRILKRALAKRIVPDYVVCIDGAPQIASFFPKKSKPITAIFNGLTVHPDTVKACSYPIYWFISIIDNPKGEMSLTRAIHYMTKKAMLVSLGNVGGTTWNIALYLEHNPIALVGLDYGYPQNTHIEETIYYRAYLKLAKGDKEVVKGFFDIMKNPDTGKEVLVDMNFNAYRDMFLPHAECAKCSTINCSPTSSLFGPGIKYQSLEEFLHENS